MVSKALTLGEENRGVRGRLCCFAGVFLKIVTDVATNIVDAIEFDDDVINVIMILASLLPLVNCH
jgi:hypothetical protein